MRFDLKRAYYKYWNSLPYLLYYITTVLERLFKHLEERNWIEIGRKGNFHERLPGEL